MEAFATVDDYVNRYGVVEDDDILEECLKDASVAIRVALDKAGVSYENPSEDFADRLMRACRSVANRILPSNNDNYMAGVTQMSTTAGPYSQQYTFSGTYGTPKLVQSELDLLGIGTGSKGRTLMYKHANLWRGRYWHDTWR